MIITKERDYYREGEERCKGRVTIRIYRKEFYCANSAADLTSFIFSRLSALFFLTLITVTFIFYKHITSENQISGHINVYNLFVPIFSFA